MFIEKARKVHGDKYDYSMVVYVSNRTPVMIICPEHGMFLQRPDHHLSGSGCLLCGVKQRSDKRRLTQEEFITRAREVHGDKYNYSQVEYQNSDTNIKIICKKHGEFMQIPFNHLKGHGCPSCGFEQNAKQQTSTAKEFITRAREVHGDRYDYSLVEYEHNKKPVKIICKKHGEFIQIPNNHLTGAGCPSCACIVSKAEQELRELVKQLVPHLEVQNNVRGLIGEFSVRFKGDKERKIIKNAELDIYIPELRLAIEYNGMYWHDVRTKGYGYHLGKRQACDRAGIRMMTIWEADWNDERKRPIIIRMLKNALGVRDERTVYARKCYIAPVPQDVYREFMNANHVQGYASAKEAKYGLYERTTDELVACMSFKIMKNRDQKTLPDGYVLWDMVRYATSCNVPGGRSKLFKFLREEFHMDHVQSFLDADYFTGISYATGGWILAEDNQHTLDMWHPKAGRQSRQAWWHAAIPRTLEKLELDASLYDPNLTQNENAYRAGVRFFENSGNRRYEWHRNGRE
ncbi:DUF723 domain-containing protein [Salmonella enterica subsp. enterica serovar Anatum]|uniref:Hef-like homing endonuclease n=1 Tax=Salmonella phage vB_SenS_Sasha TaxID=1913114 RepID=A0A1P8DTL0_9CAUD|nr:homing endonuclease [Salmonella phage vB_SenS_Sasha]KAA6846694.1 DUF723 domain-containing protein [Salmonella enterica subsp. enterica serovar Anatum]APU92762.1 hypothetical protein CPTSasha_06 [Salmonella phage vB_SenS_Sasha]KAA6939829.1 DUF723 domain-containing protein [Salmonella enterica subsp. enterica serovar Anatum]KAA7040461.1 DUF723 domain-containing protein [Salmonella enterica subsp. enterica serovar Anatum]KAA7369356.1 DUF723 domain-containing protein [Salmonella enterica subsp.